jgi:replicative DNA helicase
LRVAVISLEVTANKVLLNLLSNFYKIDYKAIAKGKVLFSFEKYYEASQKLTILTDKTDLDDIISYCDLEKPDVVVIDFLQNIQVKGSTSEYERMSAVPVKLQHLAIRNNIAILCLSQVAKDGYNWKIGDVIPSK